MENEQIINLIDRIHVVECLAGSFIAIIALVFLGLKVFIGRE